MKISRILPPASIHTAWRLPLLMACLTPVAWAQAVQTPAFLPVEGTALTRFPVVVTCPTSGATIRYTVTGAEPTVFDPVVVSGSTVNVARNMTLKAKAWSGADVSATASSAFEITGEVAAGSQSLLALVTNGQVLGWGNQDFGRLSNGSTATTNILAPAAAKYSSSSSIGNASRIASGAKHALMLDSSGNVWGFGNNLLGEAGRATPTELLYASQVTTNSAGSNFLSGCTKISAGLDFSAALESSGFVRTWGSQVSGRLANGSTATGSRKFADRAKSASSVELGGIRDIALGKDFALAREACALETAGALGKVWVWGNNASANLATGNTTAQSYAVKAKLNATTDLTDAWDIDAGDGHSVVVRWKTGDSNLQGSVWTFGSRVNGRLGDNGAITGTASYPVQVQKLVGAVYSPLTGITQVSAGPAHTLALDSAGNVWAWGANSNGALGDNTKVDKKYAVKVRNPGNTADLTNIARVSAGGINGLPSFSTAVAKDGTIYVWGSNASGILANGTTSTKVFALVPVAIGQLKTIPGFPTVTLAAAVTTPNAPGAATLTATVADPQGAATIAKTEFFVQGVLSSTRTASPWTASLTGLAQGTYSAYAKTTDADGNETTSLATSFTIAVTLDADQDGLLDSWETQKFGNLNQTATGDPDNDKVNNLNEYTVGTNPNANIDANADGIPDDWVVWRLSQSGGVAASSLPASGDPDQDELTNLVEYQNNTNPRLLDSDVDGQSDWQELAQGTNPNDVNSIVQPLAVSAHQGTSNLHVTQTLPNATPANSYALSLTGNIPPAATYELKSSNVAGGPAYEWIDISATGEHILAFETDDSALVQRPIGFSFPFYGVSYGNVYISGQGFVTLEAQGGFFPGAPSEFRAPLPNAAGRKPLISPYQQYLEPDVLGDIYYKSFPTYTVIQWEQVKLYGFDSRPTFQAVIYSDGSIRFNYKSIPLTSGGSYVVGYLSGIQNALGNDGLAASWYTGSQEGLQLHSLAPLSVRFAAPSVTPAPWVITTAATVSGNSLTWELNFQATGLPFGINDAVMQFRKNASSPILYSRTIRLNVLPLGTAGNDTLEGTAGDDSLLGLDGNDSLIGNAGDDALLGGNGNDVITGGSGGDVMDGGTGKDSYYYNLGDGNDMITDYQGIYDANDSTADYSDLYFGAGITPAMIRSSYMGFSTGNDAMKFEILGGSPGSVSIAKWTLSSFITNVRTSSRWRFHFAGGAVWDGKLFGYGLPYMHLYEGYTGTIGDDVLLGTDTAENLRGLEGNDLLQGGNGWDTYYYKWGDGSDSIQDTPDAGQLSILYIYGQNLEGQLTYDFIAPDHLRINVNHPSDPSKNGSVLLKEWYRSLPVPARDNWRIYVEGVGGAFIDISQTMRSMSTNGPDVVNLGYIHTANGQTYDAGGGNDTITGSSYAETIRGNLGNDVIYGNAGADVISGGSGDDDLRGGTESDTYQWNLGDGNDTITDSTNDFTSIKNRLVFGPGISPAQVRLELGAGLSLKVSVRNSEDAEIGSVTVNSWFTSLIGGGNHAKNWRIEFTDDPSIWDGNQLITPGADALTGTIGPDSLQGGPGNDNIQGLDGDDSLSGQDGDDTLNGGNGGDTLVGGIGIDTLDGGAGADAFYGGTGNDYIRGGTGSDTYYWQVGDGDDTLEEPSSQNPADLNVISFSGEVAPGVVINRELVRVTVSGYSDALFTVLSPTGTVLAILKVKSWQYTQSKWQVQFPEDAVPFDWQQLSKLGTAADDSLTGSVYSDDIKGLDGNDTLSGLDGDDSIYGGNGNDTIHGGNGADTIVGGDDGDNLNGDAGDDILEGANGNDTIQGGAGADVLTGGGGEDALQGGDGDDRYVWTPGSGNDTITEVYNASQTNHLIFGQEVLPSDIRMVPVGQSLRFEVLSAGLVVGSVAINTWYVASYGNWLIEFGNGEAWNKATLPTPGNDTLTGGVANDNLKGEEGDDVLSGGEGNDVLEGGPGDDILTGGTGSDQYYYALGDGNDHIWANSDSSVLKDRVSLRDISRLDVNLEFFNFTSPLQARITVLSNGQIVDIHGADHVVIEFNDASVEYDSNGVDLRLGNASVRPGWLDGDGDTFPDDVENALNAFNPTLADAGNSSVTPAADTIADAAITVAIGNRFPTITAALAAAEAVRAGKPYVVVKVEPGTYTEDLDLNAQGVFIQGPGSNSPATLVKKSRYSTPSITGKKIIFNGLRFGDGSSALETLISATDFYDGIRFTNCLFHERSVAFQALAPRPFKVTSGDVAFVHCSFIKLGGMNLTNSTVYLVNSLVDSVEGASWTGTQQIRAFSCLLDYNMPAGWQGFGVRSDGMIKVTYPGRTSAALNNVAPSDRLPNWRDIDGELRDSMPDIGCDEYIDSDNAGNGDQLADSWEIRWFGNLTSQSGGGNPDTDAATNLAEYNAETNPLDAVTPANPNAPIDLSSGAVYGSENLLGSNPLPDASAANWIFTSDGKVTFSGRQGALEYRINLGQPTIAALFLDATFQQVTGNGTITGGARVYLDNQLMKELAGSLSNVVVPLYLLSTGTHVVRIEFVNPFRDYRPLIHSIAVRALGSQYDLTSASSAIASAVSRITTLPTESLVSPAFVEGDSVARGSVALAIPSQTTSVAIQDGPDSIWFSDVPLEAAPESTAIELSFGNGQLTEQHLIRWKPTVLEMVTALTIRKGDALRLQATATGAAGGSQVTYWIGALQIGTAVLGTALPHDFETAGNFVVTAKVNGQLVAGAQLTVTVVGADFGTSLVAARSVTSQIQLPLIPSGLFVQGANSLGLIRNGTGITVSPTSNGNQNIVARLSSGGPIVAASQVRVFSVTGTGLNGGGRVLSILPDGRQLTNMSYSIDGDIPANVRIRITVWAGGSLFQNGTNTIWLTADDFDEFGVANVQVLTSGAICQSVELFLVEP